MAIRRRQPLIGGKKLYMLLKPLLSELSLGRDKFFVILKKLNLLIKRRKKYATTTDSHHRFRKYGNKVKGIQITRPHQVYVSDITYIRVGKSFMYLFLITDTYSRMIVGWHLSTSLNLEDALVALKRALKKCPNPKDIIHHSDRGVQYCSHKYVKLLLKNGMQISMTEKNHCYENSLAERVNGTLKNEFLLDEVFPDPQTSLKHVQQAIHIYNYERPHWSLGLFTPSQKHEAA